jgi:3'(2'), 5'-bisphosphate nucleotidase
MRQIYQESLFELIIPIARDAGHAINALYASGRTDFQQKDDASPVTQADLASQFVLASRLTPLLPNCPVVSEEDSTSQVYRQNFGRFWLIDPLDGTKEFISGYGEFTVNIALVEDGCSVLGVVYAPAYDALYWGGAGYGSFRSIQGETVRIHVCNKSATKFIRVVASKSHLNDSTQSFIDRLGSVRLVQAGSSLKFCRIAEGAADIYPRLAPTCEWDTAAAQAVLEGAGGVVLDLDFKPLHYGKPDVLNPPFIAARTCELIPK